MNLMISYLFINKKSSIEGSIIQKPPLRIFMCKTAVCLPCLKVRKHLENCYIWFSVAWFFFKLIVMLITWLSVLPTVAYMYLKWFTFLTCSLHESLILWFVTLFQWSVIESVLIWLDMKNNYPQWINLNLILFSFPSKWIFVFFLLFSFFS